MSAPVNTNAGARTLIDERFTSRNETDWAWTSIKGAAGASVGANGLELFANAGATAKAYADSEIHSRRAFVHKNCEIVLSSPTIDKGSRGWGYWNHSFDSKKAQIVGFLALQGSPDYAYNGLYVFTQFGASGPQLHKLDSHYLKGPHTYSIDWLDGAVSYKIDGVEVQRVTGELPTEPLRVYLWDDNAIWDFNPLKPILQDVATKAPLKVHSVKVFDS